MCDYSLEHLENVQAKEGERYILDGRITHGFILPGSGPYKDPVAACVRDGMRLRLTNLLMRDRGERPRDATVTVIERRLHLHDPQYETQLALSHPAYNDCIAFDDGRVRPIAEIWKCQMEVLPVPIEPPRDLDKLLDLYNAKPVRELIDA